MEYFPQQAIVINTEILYPSINNQLWSFNLKVEQSIGATHNVDSHTPRSTKPVCF